MSNIYFSNISVANITLQIYHRRLCLLLLLCNICLVFCHFFTISVSYSWVPNVLIFWNICALFLPLSAIFVFLNMQSNIPWIRGELLICAFSRHVACWKKKFLWGIHFYEEYIFMRNTFLSVVVPQSISRP